MLIKTQARKEFKVEPVTSAEMDTFVNKCALIYKGRPGWTSEEDHIKTINFAKSICAETARLATLAIGIQIDGAARAKWLQDQIDKVYYNLRHWVEYGCAYGTIILKPNGNGIDFVTPDRFIVTDQTNGDITGIVFLDSEVDGTGKIFYTKMEYHRFLDDGTYAITNRCYTGQEKWSTEKPISIDDTPWAGLDEETQMQGVEKPLYGVLRTPQANNVDIDSPLGMPIFSGAIEELKDLDVAYSRNAKEIADSKRVVLMDSDRLITSTGKAVARGVDSYDKARDKMHLPDYVRIVDGTGKDNIYQEINPTLNTDTRITGIDNLLSQIGYKCGFSNGYFVLDKTTGMITATQVEADDRRTIQLIKDVRDKLQSCIDGLVYALNIFADLYDITPAGEYEITYDFGDITYSYEQDKQTWWAYVVQGKVPAWMYFVKFEGMTETEAKAMTEEAAAKKPGLFEDEE